jgi:hypothetical protein
MSRKGESITLSLSESEKDALSEIAINHNCVWGTEANISGLLRKIARGQLALVAGNAEYEISQLMDSKEVKRLYQLLEKQFESENAIASMVKCKDFEAAKNRLLVIATTNPTLANQLREKYLCN